MAVLDFEVTRSHSLNFQDYTVREPHQGARKNLLSQPKSGSLDCADAIEAEFGEEFRSAKFPPGWFVLPGAFLILAAFASII